MGQGIAPIILLPRQIAIIDTKQPVYVTYQITY